jgi:hypothetical protein
MVDPLAAVGGPDRLDPLDFQQRALVARSGAVLPHLTRRIAIRFGEARQTGQGDHAAQCDQRAPDHALGAGFSNAADAVSTLSSSRFMNSARFSPAGMGGRNSNTTVPG